MFAPLLRATTKLYAEAVHETLQSLRRHAFKPLLGFVYLIVLRLSEGLLGSLHGFAGGMIRGLVLTLLMSSFLALVCLIFEGRRFSLEEFWQRTISIFGPLINTLFILFIVMLVLQPIFMKQTFLLGFMNLILFVLFNPLPEVAARRGSSGIQGFQDALEFMRENGPEWLIAVALLLGPLALLAGPENILAVIASADPINAIFILLRVSILAFGMHSALPAVILGMIIGLYYIFFVFLFRMALYERLSQSSRRKRAYALKQ